MTSTNTQLHSFANELCFLTEVHNLVLADYSAAIYGLLAFTAVITVGVVYVLAQPTDLPSVQAKG